MRVKVPIVTSNEEVLGYTQHNKSNKVTKYDLGGIIEVGSSLAIGKKTWIHGTISYGRGITKVTHSKNINPVQIRHQLFNFSLGLKFKLVDIKY